jgi:hypothetical protein
LFEGRVKQNETDFATKMDAADSKNSIQLERLISCNHGNELTPLEYKNETEGHRT